MNILITGGLGFIGSNLVQHLLKYDHKITVIDNFYTGNKDNLKKYLKNPNLKIIEHDVRSKIELTNNFDQIFNLASPASPVHYQKNSLITAETGVFGAYNILEFALKNNSQVLQASTSEVYGDPQINPQNENYWGHVNPVGPRSCYDESKRMAETFFLEYNHKYNLPVKIVRIFNTYGPFMSKNDGRVVSNFITQALSNKDLTIYGEGNQTRSFCYITDLIDGFLKTMKTKKSFIGPLNLGSEFEFSMIDFAEIILKLTKSKSKIIFKPLPIDDPSQRRPDITLARELLNWEPKVCLEEGLTRTINFYKEII